MEFLQNLLDNTSTPVLYVFILGLMTAISPCPLATNITAIAYISKEIEDKRKIFTNGVLYTLGRAISYTVLGIILYLGASKFQVSKLFTLYGERIIGPLLIIIGVLMLDILKFSFPSINSIIEKVKNKTQQGSKLSAVLLGMLFAMAFCPYSGVLYFGLLIPMTIASASGLYLPVVFAIATGLPVIIIAYMLAFSVAGIGVFYNKVQIIQKWLNKIVAVLFIITGMYYVYLFYFKQLFIN